MIKIVKFHSFWHGTIKLKRVAADWVVFDTAEHSACTADRGFTCNGPNYSK
jgi:hypothetical protein